MDWLTGRGPETVVAGGAELGPGARVRLRPRRRADILDLALDGRIGVVECVEHDDAGQPLLAVTVEDDPGRDLGEVRLPGHRFFFSPEDVEPVAGPARILVAGVGNVFLGDDGFGVAVAHELASGGVPRGADVVDFGIRGIDLLFALQRGYRAVVFVDAAPRGEAPGTVSVIEATLPEGADDSDKGAVDGHGMDPVRVLEAARRMGGVPDRALVVACEPAHVPEEDEVVGELSEPVRGAVPLAARLVRSLTEELSHEETAHRVDPAGSLPDRDRGGPVSGDPQVREDGTDVSGHA